MSNCLTVNYTLFFPALKCYYYKSERDFPDRKVSLFMGDLPLVELFTDGACSGNPGPGGYGAILRYGSIEKELSGGEPETTNNRMELTAVLVGLKALKKPCRLTIYSDSQYFCNGITKGWAESWRQNGWRKKDKKPALNPDLWEELLEELAKHEVTIEWVKGHAGHPENERCDRLAVEAYQQYLK